MQARLGSFLALFLTSALLTTTSYADTPIPDAKMSAPQAEANQPFLIPAAPSLDVKGYILMDAATGHIIASKNPDERLEPASLTKLMTLYLVFSAIQQGTIHLDDKVHISDQAWHTGGSRMFIKAGQEVTVANLVQGVIVDSGNDATVALAEYVAGSESSFVDMMNIAAGRLGMANSHFDDATGLPHDDHYTTPKDLALLTDAIIQKFPDQYHFFSEKWFTYGGIRQPNRNRLLWRFEGADGLKTGHTDKAGFCLISSAQRNNMRLITIVMGAPSDEARSADSIRLLTYGFRFFSTEKLYDANTPLTTVKVWKGEKDKSELGLAKAMMVTLPVGSKQLLKTNLDTTKGLEAPVKKGQPYGSINISLNGKAIAHEPLIALANNDKGGAWSKVSGSAHMLYNRWFNNDDDSGTKSEPTPAPVATSAPVTPPTSTIAAPKQLDPVAGASTTQEK
jgi:D-alanyl-D-alanine carboxypeptidase (penicillin-binding protein 5/6)